jgi:6-phosphogluconolactonase (cycloisomerase 2 family)
MKLSLFGRFAMATLASLALGLGMTACGGGTIGYMWVLGQQYNQIAGFKIDNYTGNLTQIPNSPFASDGAMPVSLVVKPGGRYIYVLNQGTGGGPGKDSNGNPVLNKGTSAGISVFAVGGDGTLTFQQSYQSTGYVPQWLSMDSTGSFLYVLDKYSIDADPTACLNNTTACHGAVTVFSADSATGRLTLVTNSQTQNGNINTYSFNVGGSPFMMKSQGGCLFTVNGYDQTISPFVTNSSNGQLTFGTTQTIHTNISHISSINGNSSYMFLTDNSANNSIFEDTIGSGCTLSSTTGASYANYAGTDPVYSLVDNSNAYIYVLNQNASSTNPTVPNSTLSSFHITSNGQLQPITTSSNTAGSGPVCMVEDPSGQYMYISNHNDGTVTGKLFDPTSGNLSQLSRGPVFPATGQLTCLAVSGAVD